MKLLKKGWILLSFSATMMATSCIDESPWESSDPIDGKIKLDVMADGYVMMGTRADDNRADVIPQSSQFGVSLVSNDKTYSKTWPTLAAFNNEEGFPMGNFTISAFYGDLETEGFEKPFYYGESPVQVKLGKETEVAISASLANSMVSVRYTQDFTDLFKSFNTSIQRDGKQAVLFANNEIRPAYFAPGNVNVYLNLTNEAGQQVTVNPVALTLSAKHHYIVTFGVNADDHGTLILEVDVTEDITVDDPLVVNLTDELFSTPAPVIEANGFESCKQEEIFYSFPDEKMNPEFHVTALGGLKSATLTLSAENGNLPVLGGNSSSFQLVSAEEITKSQLQALKINCFGFFNNPDKMGVVNLKDFIASLPEGTYEVTLEARDNSGKVSDQDNKVVYKIKVNGLSYSISKVTQPKFLDKEIEIQVTTNYDKLKDNFTFLATNENGEIAEVKATLTSAETQTQSTVYIYNYKLETDEINDGKWTVKVNYAGKSEVFQTVDVIMPEFTVEADPFAKRVKLRITDPKNTSLTEEQLISKFSVEFDNTKADAQSIDRTTASTGIFTVTGLKEKQQYSDFKLKLGKSNGKYYPVETFTTEEILDVPNGDFEELELKYTGNNVYRGGGYKVTKISQSFLRNWSDFEISEPKGWSTTNFKTMNRKYNHSNDDNTFFNQPSVFNSTLEYTSTVPTVTFLGATYFTQTTKTPDSYNFKDNFIKKGSHSMILRNVGWDANGSLPGNDTGTAYSDEDYYNHNKHDVSNQSAGKMFLGTYNFDGNKEEFIEGTSFLSRPSKLQGWFKYSNDQSDSNEYGTLTIKLIDENGTIIAKGNTEFKSSLDFSQFNVDLVYSDFGKKANTLCIMIASSNHENDSEIKLSYKNNQYESYYLGSYLVVDDFQFVYE